MRWNSRWVNVSIVCVGEYVGLEEIADGIWNVYFGPLRLGRLHERHMRIEDAYGRLSRHCGYSNGQRALRHSGPPPRIRRMVSLDSPGSLFALPMAAPQRSSKGGLISAKVCHPCLRTLLLPMSPTAHVLDVGPELTLA
jgi:hypothetical protein